MSGVLFYSPRNMTICSIKQCIFTLFSLSVLFLIEVLHFVDEAKADEFDNSTRVSILIICYYFTLISFQEKLKSRVSQLQSSCLQMTLN